MQSVGGISNKKIKIVKIVKIVKDDKKPQKEERELFYSLTVNLIDPANFSPPNNFLENLKKRMNIYEDISGDRMKNDRRDKE